MAVPVGAFLFDKTVVMISIKFSAQDSFTKSFSISKTPQGIVLSIEDDGKFTSAVVRDKDAQDLLDAVKIIVSKKS